MLLSEAKQILKKAGYIVESEEKGLIQRGIKLLKDQWGVDYDKSFTQDEKDLFEPYVGRNYEYMGHHTAVKQALCKAVVKNPEALELAKEILSKDWNIDLSDLSEKELEYIHKAMRRACIAALPSDYDGDVQWPPTKMPYFVKRMKIEIADQLKPRWDKSDTLFYVMNKDEVDANYVSDEEKKRREKEEEEELKRTNRSAWYDKYVRNTINDPSWRGPHGNWSLD